MPAPQATRQIADLVRIDVSSHGRSVRLAAAGEVDSSSAPVLERALDRVLDTRPEHVTIDLCSVSFLDSAGLCVLATAHRRAGQSGIGVRVLASSRAVVRPLQITGLFDLLDVVTQESGAA